MLDLATVAGHIVSGYPYAFAEDGPGSRDDVLRIVTGQLRENFPRWQVWLNWHYADLPAAWWDRDRVPSNPHSPSGCHRDRPGANR